jgi:hypothetical protein
LLFDQLALQSLMLFESAPLFALVVGQVTARKSASAKQLAFLLLVLVQSAALELLVMSERASLLAEIYWVPSKRVLHLFVVSAITAMLSLCCIQP